MLAGHAMPLHCCRQRRSPTAHQTLLDTAAMGTHWLPADRPVLGCLVRSSRLRPVKCTSPQHRCLGASLCLATGSAINLCVCHCRGQLSICSQEAD